MKSHDDPPKPSIYELARDSDLLIAFVEQTLSKNLNLKIQLG